MQLEQLKQNFVARYGQEPKVFRAPGRVNLIGEHTDYNDGFVMPAAIGFYTYAAVAARDDARLVVLSENFGESVELDLARIETAERRGHWSDYVFGVAVELAQAGIELRGADLLLSGEVPLGAGLSSSASVEVVTALALLGASDATLDRVALAQLCQRAENEFVGARVGIMDQFIASNGRADHALLLDCRSLAFELLPLGAEADSRQPTADSPEVSLVICNTMVKHALASGAYNRRRAECEEGARVLGVAALRDATLDDLETRGAELDDVVNRRCRHVISENERVLAAADALKAGDLAAFGRLMNESHRSLRDDYEVSAPELDVMVELAQAQPGTLGARMTGGGFGGCTINLVETAYVEAFKQQVAAGYEQATGRKPEIYVCTAVDAAGSVA